MKTPGDGTKLIASRRLPPRWFVSVLGLLFAAYGFRWAFFYWEGADNMLFDWWDWIPPLLGTGFYLLMAVTGIGVSLFSLFARETVTVE